mgnify:CR=1 FL=1
MSYTQNITDAANLITQQGPTWSAISPEYVARMRLQGGCHARGRWAGRHTETCNTW